LNGLIQGILQLDSIGYASAPEVTFKLDPAYEPLPRGRLPHGRMDARSNSALNSQPISKDSENVHPHKRSVVRIAPGQT